MKRLLVAMGATLLVLAASGCDWVQPGFTSANTGSDPSAVTFDPASVTSLHQLWSVPGPDGRPAQLVTSGDTVYASSPAIPLGFPLQHLDTVGAGTPVPVVPGSPFEALAAGDGTLRWSAGGSHFTSTPAGLCSDTVDGVGPLVSAGGIDFLSDAFTCELPDPSNPLLTTFVTTRHTSVLDSSGNATPAPAPYDGDLTSDPVVTPDGSVYVARTWQAGDASPPAAVGSTSLVGPSGVVFTPASPSGGLSSPAIDHGAAYVVDRAGRLYDVDLTSATVRWSADLGATFPTGAIPTPSVGDGRVFASTGTTLQAFDPSGHIGCTTAAGRTTCNPVWSSSLAGVSLQPPAVHAHRVVVRSATALTVESTDTGATLWSAPLGAGSGDAAMLGSPSIANDVVFVATQDGRLLAFDLSGAAGCGTPSSCSPVWSAPLSGAAGRSRPIIAHRVVYIGSSDLGVPTGTATRVTAFGF